MPRYYTKLYERMNANDAEAIKRLRRSSARASKVHPDNSPRRLHDRGEVILLTSEQMKRDLDE